MTLGSPTFARSLLTSSRIFCSKAEPFVGAVLLLLRLELLRGVSSPREERELTTEDFEELDGLDETEGAEETDETEEGAELRDDEDGI